MKIRLACLLALLLPLAACAQGKPPAVQAEAAPSAAAAPAVEPAPAAEPQVKMAADDPRIALAAKIPGAKPGDLRSTPISGIYELRHEGAISYVTADAAYIFAGDLYRITKKGDFPNLSERSRREMRRELIATLPESQMVVFGPGSAQYTLTVFTDVDCTWCRKLHSQIAEYNKLGFRVRYMAYPRTGPDTPSWSKAVSVWCAADRQDALTRAKRGEPLPARSCKDSPVAREYALGQQIGIDGTPGVVLEDGELIPGYVAPDQLLAHMKDPERLMDPAHSN